MSATLPADSDAPPATDEASDETCIEQQEAKAGRGFKWWHAAVLVTIIGAAAAAFYLLPVADWLRAAIGWIDDLGWIGPSVFVGIYALATILGAPSTPLNIGAGLVFGVIWGAVTATIGATIGATLSFLLARTMLRDWVQRKLDAYPTCDKVLSHCEKEPWKFIMMLRAHPLLPGPLKNYSLGTTNVKLWIFTAATLLACMPTRIMYAYLGSAGHMTLKSGNEGDEGISTGDWITYGLGFAVAITLTAGLTWFVKRKLNKIEEQEDAG